MGNPSSADGLNRFGETIIEEVVLDIDLKVRRLCTRPYKGHPKGCPNWNTRATCPPKAPAITRVFDLADPCYAVIVPFSLAGQLLYMRGKHPGWSVARLLNSRYWQGTVRKALRAGVERLFEEHPHLVVLECPEACGVLVTRTVSSLVDIEWPPKAWDHHVAIGGRPLPGLRERYPEFAAADNVHWGPAT